LTIEKLKLLFVIVNKYKKTNLFKKKKKIVLLDFWDKYKINLCGWPKLQIIPYDIKNYSEAIGVGQINNLVHTLKFRQNT
jgi:hypothetical protein